MLVNIDMNDKSTGNPLKTIKDIIGISTMPRHSQFNALYLLLCFGT